MNTDRELFLAMLYSGPMLRADAIVCLAGEDAEPRLEVALQLFKEGGAPTIVLSGGRYEPPSIQSASALYPMLLAKGVNSDRIVVESESQNTHEQAVHVIDDAIARGWRSLFLVASSYHLPRATLSFVAEILHREADIRLLPFPCSQSPWTGRPDGVTRKRRDLFAAELHKAEAYRSLGHVASYTDGIAHLAQWERH